MTRIAVVEDDPEWASLLLRILKTAGYDVCHFATPGRFFDALAKGAPDLVLLDMQLPGMHGREVVRVIRANDATRRMLVVGVSGSDVGSASAVQAFEAGVDDYFAKPLDQDLLMARLAALLRRGPEGAPQRDRLCAGPLVVVPEERSVALKGRPVELTNLEFELLAYFMRNANRVLTRGLILEAVWKDAGAGSRTVDKHVETLRRKLGPFGSSLQTVIRVGYRLTL